MVGQAYEQKSSTTFNGFGQSARNDAASCSQSQLTSGSFCSQSQTGFRLVKSHMS